MKFWKRTEKSKNMDEARQCENLNKKTIQSAKDKVVLETERLTLEKIGYRDFDEVKLMLADPDVTYAWEKTFEDNEILEWIERRRQGYYASGYDYFLAREKTDGRVVGQIGILDEIIDGKKFMGLGWILNKREWGKGYAIEGAKGCVVYAFQVLGADKLIADIRPENSASVKVAKKLGMEKIGSTTKRVGGKIMPHDIYELNNVKRSSFYENNRTGGQPEKGRKHLNPRKGVR